MMPEPPGSAKTVLLLTRMHARRLLNRMGRSRRKQRKKDAPNQRLGTGRKGTGSIVWVVFFSLLMMLNALNLSTSLIKKVEETLRPKVLPDGTMLVGHRAFRAIVQTNDALRRLDEGPSDESSIISRRKWKDYLDQAFFDDRTRRLPDKNGPSTTAMRKLFDERGSAGFKEDTAASPFFPRFAIWRAPEHTMFALALGGILLLITTWRLCTGLGSGNQDLGKVEGNLEWLFTLPVSARALCLAEVFAHTFVDPLGWIVCFPTLLVIFWSAGMAWLSIPVALLSTLYLNLIISATRNILETLLRKTLAPAKLKNFQAFFTLAGIVSFFVLLAMTRFDGAIDTLAGICKRIPPAIIWNPVTAPLLIAMPDSARWCSPGAMLLYAAAFTVVCVWFFERMVSPGLIRSPAVYEGKRGRSTERASRASFLTGIVGKDVRLLLRDRNFLVQTMIVPLIFVGYQLIFNPALLRAAMQNSSHASAVAFGLGAYTLMSTAFSVLSVEGNSLWMLYTFPRPLHSILLQKTLLWTGFALIYSSAVMIFCISARHGASLEALPHAALAMTGVAVYSFIASGIGVLATDPLEVEVRRRFRPEMVYLYMLLASMFGYALYLRFCLEQGRADRSFLSSRLRIMAEGARPHPVHAGRRGRAASGHLARGWLDRRACLLRFARPLRHRLHHCQASFQRKHRPGIRLRGRNNGLVLSLYILAAKSSPPPGGGRPPVARRCRLPSAGYHDGTGDRACRRRNRHLVSAGCRTNWLSP